MNRFKSSPNYKNIKSYHSETIHNKDKIDINILLNKVKIEEKNKLRKNLYLTFFAVFLVCLTGTIIF